MTVKEFQEWQGSDHLTVDELSKLITELANEDYELDSFRADVESYSRLADKL